MGCSLLLACVSHRQSVNLVSSWSVAAGVFMVTSLHNGPSVVVDFGPRAGWLLDIVVPTAQVQWDEGAAAASGSWPRRDVSKRVRHNGISGRVGAVASYLWARRPRRD